MCGVCVCREGMPVWRWRRETMMVRKTMDWRQRRRRKKKKRERKKK